MIESMTDQVSMDAALISLKSKAVGLYLIYLFFFS